VRKVLKAFEGRKTWMRKQHATFRSQAVRGEGKSKEKRREAEGRGKEREGF